MGKAVDTSKVEGGERGGSDGNSERGVVDVEEYF
jgi:hypothetical protein